MTNPLADERVDHPAHYNEHPSGVECIDVVEHFSFNVGNAAKYLWRAGLKSPDPLDDLKKAAWYVGREIVRLQRPPELTAARRAALEQKAQMAAVPDMKMEPIDGEMSRLGPYVRLCFKCGKPKLHRILRGWDHWSCLTDGCPEKNVMSEVSPESLLQMVDESGAPQDVHRRDDEA